MAFGRLAGPLGLLQLALLFGCSDDSPDVPTTETSRPSAGGGAPSFSALELPFGRVLVVGASDAVTHFEREYRGSAAPGPSGTDMVACSRDRNGGHLNIHIAAGEAGAAVAQTELSFGLPSAAPSEVDFTWMSSGDKTFRVRLGDGDAFKFYEYELGTDASQGSLCHLVISKIDDDAVAGTAVCRNLVASFSSLDVTGTGGQADGMRGAASATIDFSCPFRVLDEPVGSGGTSSVGGSSSIAGTSGSVAGSFSVGGSAGTSGSAGFGGLGGTGGITKHCTGSATACSLRGSSGCELGLGCTLDETCKGVSSSCYSQFDVYSCTDLEGCVWSTYSKNCSGSSWSCDLFQSSTGCIFQEGCRWSSDCTGVASSCQSLDEVECSLQPGCSWQ